MIQLLGDNLSRKLLDSIRKIKPSGPRVLVGMSGGVDSSAAALELKIAGYEVIGLTFVFFAPDRPPITGTGFLNSAACLMNPASVNAEIVSQQLDIPFYSFDLRTEFKLEIIDNFKQEYFTGRTPNPCIRCNKKFKWERMLLIADRLNCDFIATGHYARIQTDINGSPRLYRASDLRKEQSYFLWNVKREHFRRTLFPLRDSQKNQIRSKLRKYGIKTASSPDSQDVCFIPGGDYRKFLQDSPDFKLSSRGDIVDTKGKILGQHSGYLNYTTGQRKGIGVSASEPLFVRRVIPEKNVVEVCTKGELLTGHCFVDNVNWIETEPATVADFRVAIRYNDPGTPAEVIKIDNNNWKIVFSKPVRAVTPGQSAVFYKDGFVAGGGIIYL